MKNLKIFLFLLPLLAVAWGGCGKDEDEFSDTTTVSGRAFEHGTTTPLVNAEVWVVGSECSSFTTGCTYSEVAGTRVKTDANGNYSLSFKQTSGTDYEMRGRYPNYKFGRFDDILVGKTNNMNVTFIPPAWVSIRIKSSGIVPLSSGDRLYISGLGFTSEEFESLSTLDTTRITPVEGNISKSIYYSVKRNGSVIFYKQDTVFCRGNDTTRHNIIF